MSSFSLANAAKSGALWSGLMGLSISMIYMSEIPGRDVLISFIYPLLMSILPTRDYFNVSLRVLIMASIASWTFLTVARWVSPRANEALNDPVNNKSVSAPLYGSLAAVYGISIVAGSFFFGSAYNNVPRL